MCLETGAVILRERSCHPVLADLLAFLGRNHLDLEEGRVHKLDQFIVAASSGGGQRGCALCVRDSTSRPLPRYTRSFSLPVNNSGVVSVAWPASSWSLYLLGTLKR